MLFHIPTRRERFLNAVVNGDDAKVKRMLQSRPELASAVDDFGRQPLVLARASLKRTREVERILILAAADTTAYLRELLNDYLQPYVGGSFLDPRAQFLTAEERAERGRREWEESQLKKLDHISWVLSSGTAPETTEFLIQILSHAVRKRYDDLVRVLREHLKVDTAVSSERLVALDHTEELLLAYWRHLAKQWWQAASPMTAVCDRCNCDIDEGDGFLIGTWLRCEDCTYRAVVGAYDRLRKDPDYFGPGALQQATEYHRHAP
jgi:hypothetical protein